MWGHAQAVADAVQATHPDLHPLLFSNVLCTGGLARCPGFRERLCADLRPLVPDDIEVGGSPLRSQQPCQDTVLAQGCRTN